jgi:type I restriction enzyme S subunit
MENPKIRFKGFTKDWEQRKLGDVFEQTSNLVNPKEDEIELWSLTVEDGLTKKSDRYNREFLVKKDDNFKEVRPGDIVYNPMNMTLGAVGYNGMAKSVAVSGYYTTMVAKENYDTYYINTWLKSPLAIRLYRTYATGSLIEKQRVQFPTLSIIPVTFPKYEEQTKIGSYFHSLDNLITLHQRKCEQTKKLKKYMLQKMFPQNGAKVPEIRFDGFTYDWEQRKLGDMGSTYTGLSGKTKEDFGHGDAKFITYMNVFSNPVANLDMTESVEIDSKQNCVKAGDVFFTTSSETPEEVGMSSVMPENADNIYLNSFCFGYRPTEKFDLNYLAYVLRTESFRKEMTFLAQGISRYNISKNKVMEVEIPIPSLDEQSRVGQYFKNLDTLITLHQRKCDELKKMKKYMLQNMFI